MRKSLLFFVLLLITCTIGNTQVVQPSSQLKTFQQILLATNLQFTFPKDFKEIKALHQAEMDVDYAMELPDDNFKVWYIVKNLQQRNKLKVSESDPKTVLAHPDSLYRSVYLSTATTLAGKDNYTSKNLPQEVLDLFHADRGQSCLLNLYNAPLTEHYKYGLLISLQKDGTGCIAMLFLSNDNGPDFYKKVNKAYYSVRFN